MHVCVCVCTHWSFCWSVTQTTSMDRASLEQGRSQVLLPGLTSKASVVLIVSVSLSQTMPFLLLDLSLVPSRFSWFEAQKSWDSSLDVGRIPGNSDPERPCTPSPFNLSLSPSSNCCSQKLCGWRGWDSSSPFKKLNKYIFKIYGVFRH